MTDPRKSIFSTRALAPAVAASLLASCAASDSQMARQAQETRDAEYRAELAEELADYEAGEPQRCVALDRLRDVEQVGGGTLLYRQSGSLIFRTDVQRSCLSNNGFDDIIVTRSFGSQLCSGDIIHTVDRLSGITTGSCAIGEFTPYRRIDADDIDDG